MYHLPLGETVSHSVDWLLDHGSWLFSACSLLIGQFVGAFKQSLNGLPWWSLIIVIMLIAWRSNGRTLAFGSGLGLLLIYNLELWPAFIDTLVLVMVSTLTAIGIGVPLGIASALNDKFNNFLKPLLDFMQTMPSFVYLIPALMFFGLGIVPAVFATVVFAMPPAIRLTGLGIRQVPTELVEVGEAFGCSTMQLLWKIKLPLALPTIMAGVNQAMMLSLSMVVIAAMIGAGGFGQGVLAGISQMDIGKGFENGISVVILAMILERISNGFFKDIRKRRNSSGVAKFAAVVLIGLVLVGGYFNNRVSDSGIARRTITIGYVNWQEDVAVTYLWQEILQERGYTVELKNLDAAPLFIGLSRGSIDLFFDSWLPVTHQAYWDKYEDRLDNYGAWYLGSAKIGLIVPQYVTIDSVNELANYRDQFDNRIIGIDPGAGLMKATDKAIKGYGLNYELMQGSEPAMLTALETAYKEKRWIVATGWSPHWMFSKYQLKYLKDDKNYFGQSEKIFLLANKSFKNQQPEVSAMLRKFKMNERQLGELITLIKDGMDPQKAAKQWVNENRDLVNSWTQQLPVLPPF